MKMIDRFGKIFCVQSIIQSLLLFSSDIFLAFYPLVHIQGKPIARIYLKMIVRRIYEIRS